MKYDIIKIVEPKEQNQNDILELLDNTFNCNNYIKDIQKGGFYNAE